MKKINLQLLMTISVCFFSSVLAQDTTTNVPKTTTSPTESDCTKELLLSYFPQNFVKETLKKFNVPQEKWDAIAQALADKNKDVVRLVEEKAAQSSPNPLKDPALHQQAVAIFRDTLLQVFTDVANANGITDEDQIKKMFVDIQQQKAKRFVECRRQAEAAAGGTPAVKNDNDDDDDDDDLDDNEPEKDGGDEEDADNSVKFPKPRTPRYPEENRNSNSNNPHDNGQWHGDQHGHWQGQQTNYQNNQYQQYYPQ